MKKYVMFLMGVLLLIMLSACTSMAKNQQSPTLTSQLIEVPITLKEVIVAPSTEEAAAPEEEKAIPAKEPFVVKEVIVAPSTEKPVAPKEDETTKTKEIFVLKEVIVAPPTEESAASNEIMESAASSDVIGDEPVVTSENPIQESDNQSETESVSEENIRTLINTWLTSWESGDLDTYRNCYASDFRSKGMKLDAWIENKINVRQKSQNISITMDNLQISAGKNTATAAFNLHYISSVLDSAGKKTLELKRTKNGWKIYKEIMKP
jgi:hypothetical protein